MTNDNIFLPFGSNLYLPTLAPNKIPIVYRDEYNFRLFGVEKLFLRNNYDAKRWKKAMKKLNLPIERVVSPNKASTRDLKFIHDVSYVEALEEDNLSKNNNKSQRLFAYITGCAWSALLPKCLRKRILDSFKYQTGGSILAGKLAMLRGWAFNIGGGFHHASGEMGGRGFCFYADVTLTVDFVIAAFPSRVNSVLIIDLDAHQGNGIAYDYNRYEFNGSTNSNAGVCVSSSSVNWNNCSNNMTYIYLLDVFNENVYPQDDIAQIMINRKVKLPNYTEDAEYLEIVERTVEDSLNKSCPDFVVYVAGTSILKGDSFGRLSISKEGIIRRDEIVFSKVVRERKVPMVTLMCEGQNVKVFAESIINLRQKKLICW